MTGPFEDDELFDDEWVEVSDMDGHKAALRHLATIRLNDKTYMLLGTKEDDALENGALLLIREDSTVDGALEYVVSSDEQEIERVVGRFVTHLLEDELPDARFDTDAPDRQAMEPCGLAHRPGEFCYCDDPAYLQ